MSESPSSLEVTLQINPMATSCGKINAVIQWLFVTQQVDYRLVCVNACNACMCVCNSYSNAISIKLLLVKINTHLHTIYVTYMDIH